MTLTSLSSRVDYPGAGASGPFSFSFRIFNASELLVTWRDVQGAETILDYGSDYSVTGVGDRNGGTLTLTFDLAVTETLTIERNLPLTQTTDIRNQGALPLEVMEDEFDRVTMRQQQLAKRLDGAVRLPASVSPDDFDPTLPVSLTPGSAVVVNPAGTGFSMEAMSAAQLSEWYASEQITLDTFTGGVDFTAGSSTALTLSAAPGDEANVLVTRRTSGAVVIVQHDEYSIADDVLTFGSAIPSGTTRIEVSYTYVYQVNVALSQNVVWLQSGTGAATRNVRDRLRDLNPNLRDFGGVGDGVTDDTEAFTLAIAALEAADGGELEVPPGVWIVDADIEFTRPVTFVGRGAQVSVIKAIGSSRFFKLKGGNAGLWTHVIRGLGFYNVGILYGETTGDHAQGTVLEACEVQHVIGSGVAYRHNAWMNDINNCFIHNCTYGVEFDFDSGPDSVGASSKITGGGVFGNGVNLYLHGYSYGGMHIICTAVDFEQNTGAAAIQGVGLGFGAGAPGGGLIDLTDCHLELCKGYWIDLDGGVMRIRGMWAYPYGLGGDVTAFARLQNGARLNIADSFITTDIAKLVCLKGGTLAIDPTSVAGALPLFKDYVMATADSDEGHIVTGGDPLGTTEAYNPAIKVRGRPYVTRNGLFISGGGSATVTLANDPVNHTGQGDLTTWHPFDACERVIDFDITVASVGTLNTLRLFLNGASGGVNIDLALPVANGVGHVHITYDPFGKLVATCQYNGTFVVGDVDVPAATASGGFYGVRYLLAELFSSGGHTAVLSHMREEVC